MSIEVFRQTAREWLAAQTEVPEGAELSPGKIRDEGATFSVRAPVPDSTLQVDIFRLTVLPDRTVVATDRRENYKTMVADENFGLRREERLISLLMAPHVEKRDWYVSVERPRPLLDRRGIDLFVRIKLIQGDLCHVPVQVKSSYSALKQYYIDHPEFKNVVVGFVIRDLYSDTSLLIHFFDVVEEFRKRYALLPLSEINAHITAAIYKNKSR